MISKERLDQALTMIQQEAPEGKLAVIQPNFVEALILEIYQYRELFEALERNQAQQDVLAQPHRDAGCSGFCTTDHQKREQTSL